MEKKIVKTGVYSFVLALLVGLLLFKGYATEYFDGSSHVTTYDELLPYHFKLLRFSAIAALLGMLIAGLDRNNELVTTSQNKVSPVKLGCVAICVGIAAYWIVTGLYTA